MRAPPLPSSFFKNNRSRLLKALPPHSLAVIWSNHSFVHNGDSAYPFIQNTSFYYLTGINAPHAAIILVKDEHGVAKEILCIRESTPDETLWMGDAWSISQAYELSASENIFPLSAFDQQYHTEAIRAHTLLLLFPEHTRHVPPPFAETHDHNFSQAKAILERYPLHHFERLAPYLLPLRACKQPEEIEQVKNAITITIAAYRRVMALLKNIKDDPVFEYLLEAEIRHEAISRGADDLAFAPIIAGAKRSGILHYTRNNALIHPGEHVLIDIGVRIGSYHSDLTRTLPVGNGDKFKFSRRTATVYDSVKRIHDHALEILRPGLSFSDYHEAIENLVIEELSRLALITSSDHATRKRLCKKYFMHGISHFLGLEVHDPGYGHGSLQENMLLTVEPGIYIPEEGIGLRLENDILITADGCTNLSAALSLDRDEIEAAVH